jgi:hypothetical protein
MDLGAASVITKTESLLRLRGQAVGGQRIRFDNGYDDIDASKVLDINLELFDQLGNPTEISLEIIPGDVMNDGF